MALTFNPKEFGLVSGCMAIAGAFYMWGSSGRLPHVIAGPMVTLAVLAAGAVQSWLFRQQAAAAAKAPADDGGAS